VKLQQVAQHADDLDRASAFYERLLGSEPVARFDPPGLLFFDLDGVRLLLEAGAPTALHYLAVDDVDAAIQRSAATVVSPPHVIFTHADDTLGPAGADEVHAFIEDPEGNTVGLIEFRVPQGQT
jgi:methylmalonyl-CoA/ethylmalonyl-CoA epimerase